MIKKVVCVVVVDIARMVIVVIKKEMGVIVIFVIVGCHRIVKNWTNKYQWIKHVIQREKEHLVLTRDMMILRLILIKNGKQ